MTYQKAVQTACDEIGSQAALAKAIDVPAAMVHQWRNGIRPVAIQHCVAIERATGGAVTRRDLRPDDWMRIWPELSDSKQKPTQTPARIAQAATETVAQGVA